MVTSAELQCGIRRVHSMLHAMATFLDVLAHLEALGRLQPDVRLELALLGLASNLVSGDVTSLGGARPAGEGGPGVEEEDRRGEGGTGVEEDRRGEGGTEVEEDRRGAGGPEEVRRDRPHWHNMQSDEDRLIFSRFVDVAQEATRSLQVPGTPPGRLPRPAVPGTPPGRLPRPAVPGTPPGRWTRSRSPRRSAER